MIIFLNGTSSSGKSMLAREIMHQSERPFLYFSIDHLLDFWIDEKFIAFEDEPKSWFFKEHLFEKEGSDLSVEGPHHQQLHWDLIESLGTLLKKGYDFIIDEVLWDPVIFERFSRVLIESDRVYLVQVICDLIECERRENLRTDRYKGIARSLYKKVYSETLSYDLTIDTTTLSKEQSAQWVLDYVEKNNKPQAFYRYLKEMITFEPLKLSDLNWMHQWYNQAHLAKTWGEQKSWHFSDIEKKYTSYIQGFKMEKGTKKPIYPYIIYCAKHPIGYIQYYNAYDFERDPPLINLPENLASIDVFLGEEAYLNKGIGSTAIAQFVNQVVMKQYKYCFVETDLLNKQAIRAYQKAGFEMEKTLPKEKVVWMIYAS